MSILSYYLASLDRYWIGEYASKLKSNRKSRFLKCFLLDSGTVRGESKICIYNDATVEHRICRTADDYSHLFLCATYWFSLSRSFTAVFHFNSGSVYFLFTSHVQCRTHENTFSLCKRVCVCIFRVINFAAACVRCMECRIISMRIYRLVNWFEYESNGYFFNGTGLFSACFFLYVYRVFVWFCSFLFRRFLKFVHCYIIGVYRRTVCCCFLLNFYLAACLVEILSAYRMLVLWMWHIFSRPLFNWDALVYWWLHKNGKKMYTTQEGE